MVFPVVLYGCESWTIKKAECWRIEAFELWCWRRLLRVPWTARRPNQSLLKEISPKYLLEGLMLKLKLQYFGHLMGRTDSFEKILMLGKIEDGRKRDDRGWDGWMASLTHWTWICVSSGSWWWTGRPGVLRFMGSGLQRVWHDWAIELNWTLFYKRVPINYCLQIERNFIITLVTKIRIWISLIVSWLFCSYNKFIEILSENIAINSKICFSIPWN